MLLGIDFETYFAPKFTLKTLPPLLYVRDPRFKVHGAALKINDTPAFWLNDSELKCALRDFPWSDITAYAHNALFDGLVLHEIYGCKPATWVDTVGLARALLPPNLASDLATLAQFLKLGTKGKELELAKGLIDLPPDIMDQIAAYSQNDIELTYGVLQALYPSLPTVERDLMSMTIRWGTVDALRVNRALLHSALAQETKRRADTIAASGYSATELRSAKQFPEIVRSLGIEPPTKTNPKGDTAYALAKNDLQFVRLIADHPEHRHIWNGRIAANSNTTISRIQRFLAATETKPTIVMPLNYYGAHTGRWSGAGGLNVQNLERKSATRLAIEAPEGQVVVVADSSQIELRVNAWFCNQESSLKILRNGDDIYSHTATEHFGYHVTKKMPERFFGKALELALGYGMGDDKFRTQAAIGIMGTPPVVLTQDESRAAVTKYRTGHNNIKAKWKWLNDTAITYMHGKNPEPLVWKCVKFIPGECLLPNGMALQYPKLDIDEQGNWSYETTEGRTKLYGALLLENIVQALARIIVAEQMLATENWLHEHTGFQLVSSTHDEGIGICPRWAADFVLNAMLCIFSEPPTWAPDLPLAAEGGYATNYSK
jgi:DNA polymerase